MNKPEKLIKKSIMVFIIIFSILLTANISFATSATTNGQSDNGTVAVNSVICGDCNNDGSIDVLDFYLLKQFLSDPRHTYNEAMDLNVDNMVDAVDVAIMKKYILGLITTLPYTSSGTATKWVGTWATSPQLTEASNMPPSPGLSNNTLRQVVRTSIGGNQVRLKFSNEYGNSPVTLNSVHLSVSAGGGSIQAGTDKLLTFNGQESVTIAAGKTITSDTLDYSLSKLTNMAVTIYFGNVPSALTGHPGSRTTSYIKAGNCVNSVSLSSTTTDHWYIITGMDVFTEETYNAVVALGDSITDGRGSTTNGNDRWTDNLARRLLENTSTSKISTLNHGIGGNTILSGGLGPTALTRFDRDVLGQSEVRYLIVFEGVNDIGGGASSASLINAIREFITKAHAKNILVYGATITPIGGTGYDSTAHEQVRTEVNNWIRSSGEFDGVIDFDAAVRNPNNQTRLLNTYDSGDHLHLSPAGYKKMAESIDLNLFTK